MIAGGYYTGLSDADVLIILSDSNLDQFQRTRSYLPFFDLPVGVNLIVYTEDEFQGMKKQANPFVEGIARERQRLA